MIRLHFTARELAESTMPLDKMLRQAGIDPDGPLRRWDDEDGGVTFEAEQPDGDESG